MELHAVVKKSVVFGPSKQIKRICSASAQKRELFDALPFIPGNHYKSSVFWTENEIEYLQENFKTSTYEEIGKKIGRTTKAVGYKAESLGFQKVIKKSTN